MKEKLDNNIESSDGFYNQTRLTVGAAANKNTKRSVSAEDVSEFYKKLDRCETKASILSLIDPYADQFITKSRNIPVLTDLYESSNLELKKTSSFYGNV